MGNRCWCAASTKTAVGTFWISWCRIFLGFWAPGKGLSPWTHGFRPRTTGVSEKDFFQQRTKLGSRSIAPVPQLGFIARRCGLTGLHLGAEFSAIIPSFCLSEPEYKKDLGKRPESPSLFVWGGGGVNISMAGFSTFAYLIPPNVAARQLIVWPFSLNFDFSTVCRC